MKSTFLGVIIISLFAGCSLLSSGPTTVATDYINYAKAGDAESMSELVSKKAESQFGKADIVQKNKAMSNELQKAIAAKKYALTFTTEEKIDGDKAVVKVKTNDPQGNYQMIPDTFQMVKEDGAWKIDGFYR
jgi:hypothetical protein